MSLTQARPGRPLRRDLRHRKDGEAFLRSDGLCAWCLKPRPKPDDVRIQHPAAKLIRESMLADPFCSAECAASFWGLEAHRARGHSVKPTERQVRSLTGIVKRKRA